MQTVENSQTSELIQPSQETGQAAGEIPELRWAESSTGMALADRAESLLAGHHRILIGLAGAPGAGKSTIATAVAAELETRLPEQVAVVPMDGFHLAQSVIERAGQAEIKGAPQTFDAHGFVALLARLRHDRDETIYAPEFRREIDDAVAGAIPVDPQVRIVITEGNYLLLDEAPWHMIRELLDEIWYVRLPQELRVQRLVERHMHFKDQEAEAYRRATVSDQRNADLVEKQQSGAKLIIQNN